MHLAYRLIELDARVVQHQLACLNVLVVFAPRLLQPLVHHHLFILIVHQEQVGVRRQLAAEDTDFIHFIVDRRTDHPVMLFGHMGDFCRLRCGSRCSAILLLAITVLLAKL